MTAGTNAPTIIKRKKVIAGGGHHGGAWKVAIVRVFRMRRFAPGVFRNLQLCCRLKRHSDGRHRHDEAQVSRFGIGPNMSIYPEQPLNPRASNAKNLSEIHAFFSRPLRPVGTVARWPDWS